MDHDLADRAQPSTLAQRAQPSIATYLICQNTLLRTGVSRILDGTRFTVADDKSSGHEVPDLVILCDSLSHEGSVETIRQLKAQYPGARVVALGDNLDPWTVRELCAAGLDGLCPSGMSPPAMCKALELVMLGERFLPISVSLALLNQPSAPQPPTMGPANDPAALAGKFSDREAQILKCLTTGASNKLIARELGLAEATVKVHIKAILRKAKAANRTQAAMWASQHFGLAAHSPAVELAR
ncbi:LuxR C-terminal-related transcriptional regulator [Microvirga arabica]|uniref:LuxR C-terminal-related transcriptional regulator n=1 Tax=Microvirga arabica TaxID=1128671 RepID=UPI001939C9AF|nr:response regulator transcription factor [Microvirga arabica]MBM1172231.1 response regulator transcription factor [Microvirga arabica]